MKLHTKRWPIIFLLMLLVGVGRIAQGQVPREYELKAAFLYNFTLHVAGLPHTGRPRSMVLGVVGSDPFRPAHRRQLEELGVSVRVLPDAEAIRTTDAELDIVFIPAKGRNAPNSGARTTAAIQKNEARAEASQKQFLIVTEFDAATETTRDQLLGTNTSGAMVNFWIDPRTRKLNMDVYQAKVKQAGFEFDKVLRGRSNYRPR